MYLSTEANSHRSQEATEAKKPQKPRSHKQQKPRKKKGPKKYPSQRKCQDQTGNLSRKQTKQWYDKFCCCRGDQSLTRDSWSRNNWWYWTWGKSWQSGVKALVACSDNICDYIDHPKYIQILDFAWLCQYTIQYCTMRYDTILESS